MGTAGVRKLKICVVLTTRGNYAKLKSVIAALQEQPEFELQLILGGMVILEKYGGILNSEAAADLPVRRRIHFVVEGENLVTMAKSAGVAVTEFSTAFEDLQPDVVFVIGDRFECLPVAVAASYMNIHVAHIEGGEVSGSIDESIRHAITKLAHLHFPSSKGAARRIERMGEDASAIFPVGSTSLDVIRGLDLADLEPLRAHQKEYGLGEEVKLVPESYITVIQHPVTTEYECNLAHVRETISALEELRKPTVWILPNMDAGSDGINKGIRMFRESRQLDYIHFFKSLPIELFAPLLKNSACIVGNSSCGIREAAFLGAPSVNIGTRQHCRERAQNVTDVDYDRHEIAKAVSQQMSRGRYESSDLYGDGHAAEKIVEVLHRHEFKIQKTITY